jgi:hypothetical protein
MVPSENHNQGMKIGASCSSVADNRVSIEAELLWRCRARVRVGRRLARTDRESDFQETSWVN